MDMAMNLCRNTQVGYFAFTRDLTVCLKQFRDYQPTSETIQGWMGTAEGRSTA
jgi:ribonucleoside-triphosphate reductase